MASPCTKPRSHPRDYGGATSSNVRDANWSYQPVLLRFLTPMDPISFTGAVASSLTIVEVLIKLGSATVNAIEYATVLAEVERGYDQITNSLNSSITILHQLLELRDEIATIDDEQIQHYNIPINSLNGHLKATIALSSVLKKRRARLEYSKWKVRRIISLVNTITRPDDAQADLQRCSRQFTQSMGCLSIILNLFSV